MPRIQSMPAWTKRRVLSTALLLACLVAATCCGGQLDTTGNSATPGSGGSTAALGGAPGSSGGSSDTTGGSRADYNHGTCASDSDCTLCVYFSTPASLSDCGWDGYSCCGATMAMSKEQCATNEAAWNAYCQDALNAGLRVCPCMAMTCSSVCVNGSCAGSCS